MLEQRLRDLNEFYRTRYNETINTDWTSGSIFSHVIAIRECLDVTDLSVKCTSNSIFELAKKINDSKVASLCVYPKFIKTVETFKTRISTVIGYPTSHSTIEVKFKEIEQALACGACEFDIVMNLNSFFNNDLSNVVKEIQILKELVEKRRVKVIIESGILTLSQVEEASRLVILGGANFIKTSTGKEVPGVNLEAVATICDVIKYYRDNFGIKTGIKISGGIKTLEDALIYYTLVARILGKDWLAMETFRIGSSSLYDEICRYSRDRQL
jgi:deoxyribose-phosphate aldolase